MAVFATPGTALGEVAFIFGVRQHAAVAARERTVCLALHRDDYKAVISEFIGEAGRVQSNVLEQMRQRGSAGTEAAGELQELIVQRKQAALYELLNAASAGEVHTVRTLLSGAEGGVTLQADEADYE